MIELKRKELELRRVEMARAEMEFHILEREADIARLRANIENQDKRIAEIKEELKALQPKG